MTEVKTSAQDGQRGKAEHHVREQIVTAANEHFSHYGYGKTTVSDLAKAIGFSKAYIYKFFDSKQAIGEAICANCLAVIMDAAKKAVSGDDSATEKFRRLFKSLMASSLELFFADRKLYDISAFSSIERWQTTIDHEIRMHELLRGVIQEGRNKGEFERKTPIDEVCRAIMFAMQPFINPVMLQHNLDVMETAPVETCNLVLRSLSP
jgi:AcrR family transcriptional regulator